MKSMDKTSINSIEETKDSFRLPNEFISTPRSTISHEDFVFIVLDCYSYAAGEKVTGEVLLNITKILPNGSLIFQSQGVEEIFIYDPKEKLKIIAEERSEVFSIKSSLRD